MINDSELLRLASLPLYTFRPRPNKPEELDEQSSFVNDKFKGLAVALGGNASGKSTAGAYKVARFLLETKAPRKETPFWILSQSMEMASGVCWGEKLSTFITPEHIKHITWYNQGRNFPSAIVMHNGWTIEIKSYDQDRKRLQARSLGGFWCDEAVEQSILIELLARCRDYNFPGSQLYTLTPLIPLPELQDIYDHKEQYPDYRFYRFSTRCNTYLSEGFADQLARMEVPALRETRLTGAFGSVEGAVFRQEWFKYYKEDSENYYLKDIVVKKTDCFRIVVVDLAISLKESADFTVAQVWDITPQSHLVLLHEWRARAEGPTIIQHITDINEKYCPVMIGVEDVGYQKMMLQMLRQEGLPVKPLSTEGKDKKARSSRAQVKAEAGQVWLPSAAWIRDWLAEILTFPEGAFLDRGDTMAYACIIAAKRGVVEIEKPHLETEEERLKRIMWGSENDL